MMNEHDLELYRRMIKERDDRIALLENLLRSAIEGPWLPYMLEDARAALSN